ncbi:MAG: hypothetical protein IJU56_07965 [Clostridia bacterium]|nr:hypothetical protein [Clostridia bacterium]
MAELNVFLDKIFGQLFGVTSLIATFFGGLADLATAPVDAANGVAGVAAAIKAVKDSLVGAAEELQAAE